MEDFGAFILLGVLLVVFGLSLGTIIGWFKYRRYGAGVDYGALGIGFIVAGAVALLVLVPTDGPWIIGIAFIGAGAAYLARRRRVPATDTDRAARPDRTGSRDVTASTAVAESSDRDAPSSRIEVGDRVLLTTDLELPRRDRDWQPETLPQGTEGVVLALVDDEDRDDEATGMTDTGVRVALPGGVLVRVADHEYGIRDSRFAAGQVIVQRRSGPAADP